VNLQASAVHFSGGSGVSDFSLRSTSSASSCLVRDMKGIDSVPLSAVVSHLHVRSLGHQNVIRDRLSLVAGIRGWGELRK
jgi:hypothetical protein